MMIPNTSLVELMYWLYKLTRWYFPGNESHIQTTSYCFTLFPEDLARDSCQQMPEILSTNRRIASWHRLTSPCVAPKRMPRRRYLENSSCWKAGGCGGWRAMMYDVQSGALAWCTWGWCRKYGTPNLPPPKFAQNSARQVGAINPNSGARRQGPSIYLGVGPRSQDANCHTKGRITYLTLGSSENHRLKHALAAGKYIKFVLVPKRRVFLAWCHILARSLPLKTWICLLDSWK